MIGTNNPSLEALWNEIYEINKLNFPDNELMPIFGGGQSFRPKFMFVFINPNFRNISSSKDWEGPRFPFVGTKNIWRTFSKAEMFESKLLDEIHDSKKWSVDLANRVLSFLRDNNLYFTNIVKWTCHDASLPDSKKIELFLPILKKEISIIRPEYVVAFGSIPFEHLTGSKIKLSEYYETAIKNNNVSYIEVYINNFKTKVIPCYFPIGRGDPKKTVDILKLLKNLQ